MYKIAKTYLKLYTAECTRFLCLIDVGSDVGGEIGPLTVAYLQVIYRDN